MLMSKKTRFLYIMGIFCLLSINSIDSHGLEVDSENFLKLRWTRVATAMPDSWYGSDQAKSVAENVLKYQTEIGGWAKNSGYHNNSVKQDEWERIKKYGIGATFDNDSTLTEMKFLAKVYAKIKDERYRDSFMKALNYIFKAQYPNGGWPQYYPPRKRKSAYSAYITYNDNAMVNVMKFLDEIVKEEPIYAPMQISAEMRLKAKEAFDKGVECILRTQIIIDGLPTVWCAQHDHVTLEPAGARSYELPSFSGSESVGVTMLLMDIENPSKEIINAVNGAVKWFQEHKIEGIRIEEIRNEQGQRDRIVVQDSTAPPLWGRFHDLETGKPFFCDRDGIKKSTLAEIGINRRGGYRWYTNNPQKVLDRYPQWASKYGVKKGHVVRTQKGAIKAAPIIDKKIDVTIASEATDIAKLEAAVGLSDEQNTKVQGLLNELKDKRREIKGDANLSRNEIRVKMKALNEEYLGKGGRINALMTAEQFAKWNKLQQAIRAARNASGTDKPSASI